MKKQLLMMGMLLSVGSMFNAVGTQGYSENPNGPVPTGLFYGKDSIAEPVTDWNDASAQLDHNNPQMEIDYTMLQVKKQGLKMEERHYMKTLAQAVAELCKDSSGQACLNLNKANKDIASLKKDIKALNKKLHQ